MRTFNFFEKLWEHSRTLKRVGVVLVMCLIAIPQMWAGNNCGFWTSGSGEITFTANGVSKTMAFNNSTSDYTSIGTVTTLEISSFWIKTWKKHIKDGDFTGNVCQVEMYYAIHTSKNVWGDDSEKHKLIALHDGSYTDNYTDDWTTYNQQWKHISSTDVLDGLTPGTTYWIDFYFEIQGNNGSKDGCHGQQATLNNNTGNYHASFTYASEKTTFEPGQYVYLDARNQSWWKGADFDARFYFKRYDTSADIGDAVVCSHSNKLEDWVYYAIVPDNDYVGQLQVNRVNTSDADMDNYWWNKTTVKVASDRSNASQNCLNGTSSESSDWDASWGTYCPPKATSVISDNGTVTYGGNGGSSTPYLVEKGGTIKVSASSTNIIEDTNMETRYQFYDASTSKQNGTGTTYNMTANASAGTTHQMKVNSYNYYNSTSSTALNSSILYYRTVNCYTVTYNANGGTGSVPAVSGSKYMSGTNVTLATNTGSLAKSGYKLVGWNTASNGTGTHYDLGATLSSISANQTLYAEWLQIHTPSQFSYTSDYGKTPKLVSGYNYEWYSISKNGTGNYILAGEQTNSVSGSAANIAMSLPGTDSYKHQDWFTAKYEAANGSYSPGAAKTGVFEDVMSTGPCIRLKDSDEGLKMAVSGYSQFSFIATDNTADKSKNKYIKVIIDGNDVTGSTVSTSASIRSFAITSNDAHLIELRPAGGNGSSDFYCFALKLPDEVATYDITYHCNDATSGCPDDLTDQTALPSTLPTGITKNGYTFDGWYTDEDCTEEAVASATLSDDADLYAKWTCTTPTITGPSNATVCKDASSPELSVSADANGGSLSYQWYVNTTNAATVDDDHDIDGETSDSYDAPAGTAGTKYYYCVVTNTTGGCSATSGIATVTVKAPVAISSQPSSVAKANVGSASTLTVSATGAGLSYQWYTCDDSEKTNAAAIAVKDNATADDATLSITPASVGVTYYYCVVSGDCGDDVTSNVVSITAKNAISPTLSYSSSVTYGNTLSASKTGTWGDGSVTYTSSDATKVSVASDGTVTGEAVGSATITATIEDGTNYWGGSTTSGTITVNKADLAGTASTGTATSVTHNSASLPFTITDITGVASITIKVYAGESLAKTYSGITPASSGSYSATGLSASTTYTYTITLIGDANHNDKAETSKSTSFTTTAAPSLSAISANTMYQAVSMANITFTESDQYFEGLSTNTYFKTYGSAASSTAAFGKNEDHDVTDDISKKSFTSAAYITSANNTDKTDDPTQGAIEFITPSKAGVLYIYLANDDSKLTLKKKGTSTSTSLSGAKYKKMTVDANTHYFINGAGSKRGIYGIYFDKAPELSSSDPADGATDVPVSGTIVLTFDESIADVDGEKFSLSTGSISAVAVDGTDDTKVNITYSGLPGSTEVTLSVAAGAVTDAAGNTSAALSDITFTTVATGYAITTGDHDGGTIAIKDGEGNDITSADADETVYLEATPNTGYTFGSWTVVKTEGGERVSVAQSWKPSAHFTMPGEAVTVSAEFAQVNYAIMPRSIMHFRYTVQVGEAEAVDGYARAHYGDVITLAQSSIADGYHLKTWGVTKTESGDPIEVVENQFTMPAEDVTVNPIVGKWYTVTFNSNGGSTTPDPITQTAVDGAITMPAAPTKSGYTFVNWMIGGTTVDAGGSYTPPTDVTAYATWKADCAGGGCETLASATAKDDHTGVTTTVGTVEVTNLADAKYQDYDLKLNSSGYFTVTAKTGYSPIVAGDKLTVTMYNTKGSEQSDGFKLHSKDSETTHTAAIAANSTGDVEYTLTEDDIEEDGKIKIFRTDGDDRFHAILLERCGGSGSCYYVTYNGNGAAGGYTNDETAYSSGTTVTVATNENNHFTHPGYSFTGWNTAPDGSGTGYDPDDDDHKTFAITGNTTLYAQWTPATLYFTRAVDGDWTDPLNWKVSGGDPGCIPTIEHDVVIQGKVTLYGPYAEDRKGHGVAKSVRIEFGKNVEIWTEGGLIVAEDIKAKHAVDGEYEATTSNDLSIETTILGNGTLITGEENSTTQALYKFRTKAFTCYVNQDGKRRKYYYNQYCGIPFQPIDPMTSYYGCTIYEYGAATDSWITPTTEYLRPFVAYNLLRKNAEDGDDIWLRGTLNLPGIDGTKLLECGWRGDDTGTTIDENKDYQDYMFANSWTAPIDISSLDEEDCSANLVQSIYMFNTGYEREKGVKEIGNKDGQWSVFPFKAGKYMKDAVIPGTQAFLVTAMSSGASLTLKYGKHVYYPALEAGGANNFPTRAPKRAKREEIAPNKLLITVLSDNTILDNMYIFEREDFTEEFDNGWDGTKIIGSTRAPQLYTRQGNNKMEVAAVPEMEGLEIGFVAGTDTNSYAFEFEYLESEPLYLYDRETMEYTPIENKGTYSFSTEDNLEHARFVLTRSKSPQIATGFIDGVETSNKEIDTTVRKIIKNDHVYILRGGHVYSIDGSMIK